MTKNIILFNQICSDGSGDFYHLIDFLITLKQIYQDDYNIIPIIKYSNFGNLNNTAIEKALKAINIHRYYIEDTLNNTILANTACQDDLANAKLLISVSYPFDDIAKYTQYCPKENIPLMTIFEHDTNHSHTAPKRDILEQKHIKILPFDMGLGEKRYGIKLRNLPKLSKAEALNNISDEAFKKILNIDECLEDQTFFMPCYFNKQEVFIRLLALLVCNPSLGKNRIVIPLSGLSGELLTRDFLEQIISKDKTANIFKALCDAGLKQIIVDNYHEAEQHHEFIFNQEGDKTIRIITGYFLEHNKDYELLIQAGDMAGVSGDNSLELALSCRTPVYYISTNHRKKRSGLPGLANIIKQVFASVDEKIGEAFSEYFTSDEFLAFATSDAPISRFSSSSSGFKAGCAINLALIVEHFKPFADYIMAHHNYYDVFAKTVSDLLTNPAPYFEMLSEQTEPIFTIDTTATDMETSRMIDETMKKAQELQNKFEEMIKQQKEGANTLEQSKKQEKMIESPIAPSQIDSKENNYFVTLVKGVWCSLFKREENDKTELDSPNSSRSPSNSK